MDQRTRDAVVRIEEGADVARIRLVSALKTVDFNRRVTCERRVDHEITRDRQNRIVAARYKRRVIERNRRGGIIADGEVVDFTGSFNLQQSVVVQLKRRPCQNFVDIFVCRVTVLDRVILVVCSNGTARESDQRREESVVGLIKDLLIREKDFIARRLLSRRKLSREVNIEY